MKKFSDFNFAPVYGGTSGPDALNDFLIPALSVSTSYDRVAGYFSSAVFVQIAPGITPLVQRGGKIRLVTSHAFTKKDIAALAIEGDDLQSLSRLATEFEDTVREAGSNLAEQMRAHYVKAMCWLLKNNQLEIRVVIPGEESLSSPEKFHSKFGILKDESGEKVVFAGSVNETWLAWSKNIENVSIYKSSIDGLRPYLSSYEKSFEDLWAGNLQGAWRTVDLPAALKDRLVDLAPDGDFPDIDSVGFESRSESVRSRQPRDYQLLAVTKWEDANRKGLLEMATGTGKTFTASLCIKSAISQGTLFVVVVAPYQHIADQWAKELSEFNPLQVGVRGSWQADMLSAEYEASMGSFEHQVIIVVKNTASNALFIERSDSIAQYYDNFMFIGDEVHWLGAPSLQAALNPKANFRLGLSATPNRYFDGDGTQVLRQYFGENSVFVFDLQEALTWKDPVTGIKGVLAPYTYHPIFVTLTEEEEEEFQKLSQRIAQLMSKDSLTPEEIARIESLRLLRSNIAKSASNKLPAFAALLSKLKPDLNQTIVYCADFKQMEKVMEISRVSGIDTASRITGLEGSSKSDYFKGLSEREHILENFARGNHQVLFAIDCLDEGVDVPSARMGIILASSGNPKEFIQRRGRLMRKAPGKIEACIYDLVVLPQDNSGPEALRKVELSRILEFAQIAENREEVESLIATY